MAIASTTTWELQSLATAGNLNGGGFNRANANFLTNFTATSATGNAPVISSASYNFVAGDVGAYIYVSAGTNWTPGWYKITSVAANAATVDATIGHATTYSRADNLFSLNTVAGVATTASPTGGTCGVDYSGKTAAIYAPTDLASTGASTTLTSATAGFTPVMVGNLIHQTTTGVGGFGLIGWFEIVSYTNTTTVVTDRTTNNGTAEVGVTGAVGGALSLNTTGTSGDDTLFEAFIGANKVFIKADGAYSTGESISVASASATAANPVEFIGFNTYWADTPTTTSRPTIAAGANTWITGTSNSACFIYQNIIFTTTAATGIQTGFQNANSIVENCKITNTSTTAARDALRIAGNSFLLNCEFVSQNGNACDPSSDNNVKMVGCYAHDSDKGFITSATRHALIHNIFEANTTAAVEASGNGTSAFVLDGNTIYGREAKIGIGLNFTGSATADSISNNIFYGLTSGIVVTTTQGNSNFENYNDFFNNTTNRTLMRRGKNSLALDPTFTGASQITGTTATTSGSVLTQSGGNFGAVTDNIDYLHVTNGGTGSTVGVYLITLHTTTTLTVNNALGTNSAGDCIYFVTTGHNFGIGTNLKAMGFPGAFNSNAVETTGYLDIGAAQRQETGSSATTAYTFS